ATPTSAPTSTPTPTDTPTSAPTATPTPTATSTPTPTSAPSDFVPRGGTSRGLDGNPWYLYGASQLGGLDDPSARATLAVAANLNTLPIVNFLDEKGSASQAPFDEASWNRFDAVIAASSAAGLHVVLDLSTYRN